MHAPRYPKALSGDAVAAIGERYLIELTSDALPPEQQNFPLAAKLCPELLGDDVDRWDQWVTLFFAVGQVRCGAVRCRVVWCGAAWCGAAWCGALRCCSTRVHSNN